MDMSPTLKKAEKLNGRTVSLDLLLLSSLILSVVVYFSLGRSDSDG